MSLPPSEIPLGAMRFNSDSRKLEYWMGSAWMQVKTFSPNLGDATNSTDTTGGSRALIFGGEEPATNLIEFITIESQGNGTDFADLSQAARAVGACASNVRAFRFGGYRDSPGSYTDTIDFGVFSSQSDFTDFGDMSAARFNLSVVSNQTRGVAFGGEIPSPFHNEMQYITMTSAGNTVDFGDLTQDLRASSNHACNPTRGFAVGGYVSPGTTNSVIESWSIPTTGNSANFSSLRTAIFSNTVSSNSTRALSIGGRTPSAVDNVEKVELISGGTGTDFGTISQTNNIMGSTGNSTRIVAMGGNRGASPYPPQDRIEYFQISTGGQAGDFGDLGTAQDYPDACSNAHGGLG